MNKEAIAAKSLLKALAAGTTVAGLTGGAGYLGHNIGYKGGATDATNEMAAAFTEANQRENQQIKDSFNLFNKKENAAIASNYMRRGMALGANLHATGKIKTPAEMSAMAKTSSAEDIYNAAFEAELEKLGAHPLLKAGIGVAKKLFKKGRSTAKGLGKTYKGMSTTRKKQVAGAAATSGAAGYALG